MTLENEQYLWDRLPTVAEQNDHRARREAAGREIERQLRFSVLAFWHEGKEQYEQLCGPDLPTAHDIVTEMLEKGMIRSPKEAEATLYKWCGESCWEYGGNVWSGWKTGHPEKPERLRLAWLRRMNELTPEEEEV